MKFVVNKHFILLLFLIILFSEISCTENVVRNSRIKIIEKKSYRESGLVEDTVKGLMAAITPNPKVKTSKNENVVTFKPKNSNGTSAPGSNLKVKSTPQPEKNINNDQGEIADPEALTKEELKEKKIQELKKKELEKQKKSLVALTMEKLKEKIKEKKEKDRIELDKKLKEMQDLEEKEKYEDPSADLLRKYGNTDENYNYESGMVINLVTGKKQKANTKELREYQAIQKHYIIKGCDKSFSYFINNISYDYSGTKIAQDDPSIVNYTLWCSYNAADKKVLEEKKEEVRQSREQIKNNICFSAFKAIIPPDLCWKKSSRSCQFTSCGIWACARTPYTCKKAIIKITFEVAKMIAKISLLVLTQGTSSLLEAMKKVTTFLDTTFYKIVQTTKKIFQGIKDYYKIGSRLSGEIKWGTMKDRYDHFVKVEYNKYLSNADGNYKSAPSDVIDHCSSMYSETFAPLTEEMTKSSFLQKLQKQIDDHKQIKDPEKKRLWAMNLLVNGLDTNFLGDRVGSYTSLFKAIGKKSLKDGFRAALGIASNHDPSGITGVVSAFMRNDDCDEIDLVPEKKN